MDREQILAILRLHAPELHAAGITRLRLFGSAARGEMRRNSDVDLLADFDSSKQITLVTLGSIENRLSALLGVTVELSTADWMTGTVREHALQESLVAF